MVTDALWVGRTPSEAWEVVGGATGTGPGEGTDRGSDSGPQNCCEPYRPSPQEKRNRVEGDVFQEGEVFFMEERDT